VCREQECVSPPGSGWVSPLAAGEVNLGVGALATAARPASVAVKDLLRHYARSARARWELDGEPRSVTSALLPMGGAVSGVAGRNWAAVGDAAACVNPLNGEGIDYALEGGRLLADLLGRGGAGAGGAGMAGTGRDLTRAWPELLRATYGESFAIARDAARLLTYPRFLPLAGPLGMCAQSLLSAVLLVHVLHV